MKSWTFNLFDELERMRSEFDRLLGAGAFSDPIAPFVRTSFLPGRAARGYPLVNISEENDNYTVEALTPGISPDQIQISVTGDQLTISGEKNPLPENVKPESIHRTERSAGRFLRTITLPEEIDRDKVAASFKNGILKITLPRAEDAKPKMIHVNVD